MEDLCDDDDIDDLDALTFVNATAVSRTEADGNDVTYNCREFGVDRASVQRCYCRFDSEIDWLLVILATSKLVKMDLTLRPPPLQLRCSLKHFFAIVVLRD
ncbi:hypothetical protein J6590_019549 [Homalodisca vitripennis]|nr:hypothetical protein J6590_019549 [Homalodisca vitripennis]